MPAPRIQVSVLDKVKRNSFSILGVLACSAVFLLLVIPAGSLISASAMGQAPTTCNNRYDGNIQAFTITTPHGVYYPGQTFYMSTKQSYSVSFKIHVFSTSSNGNTKPGSTWYSQDANGFAMGTCVPGQSSASVRSGSIVSVSGTFSAPPCASAQGGCMQQVEFYTYSGSAVYYTVVWK